MSDIIPVINSSPVVSATYLQPITPTIIPAGTWTISGLLTFEATDDQIITSGEMDILVNQTINQRYFVTQQKKASINIFGIITSEGNSILTIPTLFQISDDKEYYCISEESNIKIVCIAPPPEPPVEEHVEEPVEEIVEPVV